MTQTYQNPQSTPNTWSRIIQIVQNANIRREKAAQLQKKQRRYLYRDELDQQINLRHHQLSSEKANKYLERKQIQQQVQNQISNKYLDRMTKMRAEQNYRHQNWELAQSKQSREILKKRDSEGYKYSQQYNPFINLVKQQDDRMRETKQKFQMQNKINNVQIQIHNDQRKKQKQLEKRERQIYQQYIENDNIQRQTNRGKFLQKYMKIGKSQAAAIGYKPKKQEGSMLDSSKKLEQQYTDFVEHQYILQNPHSRKSQEDILNTSQKKLNQNVQIPDSSPAFLGRNPISSERQKQLNIVDRVILRNPVSNYQSNDRVRSLDVYQASRASNYLSRQAERPMRQISMSPKLFENHSLDRELITLERQLKNRRGSQLSNNPNFASAHIKPIYHANQPHLKSSRIKTEPSHSPISGLQNPENMNRQKNKKCFRQYDLISGRQKHIFL